MRRLLLLMLFVLAACSNDNPDGDDVDAPEVQPTQVDLAALVNDAPITREELETELLIFEAGAEGQAADREALVGTVLERLINYELYEQAATGMGIEITEAAVQTEIDLQRQEAANAGYTLDNFFAAQGITAEQYPILVRRQLLVNALTESVTASVGDVAPAIQARHILVADEATALEVLDLLNNGADFAQVALDYSQDPLTRESGGDLGIISPGDLLQRSVEDAIFSLPENSRALEPVQSVLGYHVIEALTRQENVPLDTENIVKLRQQAWEDWLEAQRASAEIERFAGPNAN